MPESSMAGYDTSCQLGYLNLQIPIAYKFKQLSQLN